MSQQSFKDALTRLATDSSFRDEATNNPARVVEEFELTREELRALANAAKVSGADMTQVDAILGQTVASQPPANPADWSVSCCCCCCCGTEGIVVNL